MPSPPKKPMSLFNKRWDLLSERFMSKLKSYLNDGMNYNDAIEKAYDELNIQGNFKKFVENTVYESFISGIGKSTNIGKTKEMLLDKTWSGKIKLSSRINKVKLLPIIKDTIRTQLKESNAIRKISRALTVEKLTSADYPKYLTRLEQNARRVLYGKTSQQAFIEYRMSLNNAKRQIEKLVGEAGTIGSERLRKSYENIIKKIEKSTNELTDVGLDKAIERGIQSKARYNAERIARTESARAYGEGMYEKMNQDEDVTGYKFSLSYKHDKQDVCDVFCESDLYGMGKGVYPINVQVPYPFHPNCLCVIDPVYKKVENQEFDKNVLEDALDKQTKRQFDNLLKFNDVTLKDFSS